MKKKMLLPAMIVALTMLVFTSNLSAMAEAGLSSYSVTADADTPAMGGVCIGKIPEVTLIFKDSDTGVYGNDFAGCKVKVYANAKQGYHFVKWVYEQEKYCVTLNVYGPEGSSNGISYIYITLGGSNATKYVKAVFAEDIPVPTATPTPTSTATPTATPTDTPAAEPTSSPIITPTATPVPTAETTPTATTATEPTQTPSPTAVKTQPPASTPAPTAQNTDQTTASTVTPTIAPSASTETVTATDEPVAIAPAEPTPGEILIIEDEEVPASTPVSLPKTGGIPDFAMYGFGGALLLSGILLKKKK